MKRRSGSWNVHSIALLLLLTGVLSGRLCVGSPFVSLEVLQRSVVLPSQHLEEGVYAIIEAVRVPGFSGRIRMVPIGEDPFQVHGFSFKGSDIVKTISDSGGSLQLLLLLVLCAAVLCCASMSISPWYKSESYLLRKTLTAVYATAAFVSEFSVRGAHQQGFNLRQSEGPSSAHTERSGKRGQQQAEKALSRKAKSKRRKGAGVLQQATPPQRGLEKTGSSSNSSVYEISSNHSGDIEPEMLAHDERTGSHATPADLQIARLQAEAARQSSQRAAKQKGSSKKQGEALGEQISAKLHQGSGAGENVQKLEKASIAASPPERVEPSIASPKDSGKESMAGKVRKPSKSVMGDSDVRDRIGRRPPAVDKGSNRLSQVLVVPRRPAGRGRPTNRPSSDDERDGPLAPGTPERSASAAGSTFSSTQPALWSPSNPSRPYAQVAKESSSATSRPLAPLSSLPPPPPPPPARMSALPQTAVFAQEFHPASSSHRTALNAAAPAFSPGRQSLAMTPPPAHVAYLDIQSPERQISTSSPLPSPFPGMSLHRRMVSPSSQTSPVAASEAASLPSSGIASQSSGSAFRGFGFPGVVDTIWSSSAVGAGSSWLPAGSSQLPLGSFDSGKASLFLPDDCELVDRQDSW